MTEFLADLQARVRRFAQDRDWEQFHTPRNLAASISVESAELLEHFQWDLGASPAAIAEHKRVEIGDELADVLIYLVRLADVLNIDLRAAADVKLAQNALKYPVEASKGKSNKYSEIER